MLYELYYKKEECILQIKPAMAAFKNKNVNDDIKYHNNCYYLGNNRKALKEKAIELKEEWRKEAEERLNKVLAIKL